jgi:hypothetical protein
LLPKTQEEATLQEQIDSINQRLRAFGTHHSNQPVAPAGEKAPVSTMPKISGVTFEHRQGMVVAIGEHLFDKKELLKAAGFQWDKTGKAWLKKAA